MKNLRCKIFYLIFIYLFTVCWSKAAAKSPSFRSPCPKNQSISIPKTYDTDPQGSLQETALLALLFFQIGISPADGDRCPMYPSCSQYAKEAIQRYGVFQGIIVTAERLLRCGRETDYPLIDFNGRLRYYDPLLNNILWK